MKPHDLRKHLEAIEREFVLSDEIKNDALAPALRFTDPRDREIAAFVCALFAYGNVKQIIKSVDQVFGRMDNQPHSFLQNSSKRTLEVAARNWRHRFNTSADLLHLWLVLKQATVEHASLQDWFKISGPMDAYQMIESMVGAVDRACRLLKLKPSKSFWYLFPRPSKGSACKRLNLYLRWMIGTSPMDLSLWKDIGTERLIIPLDTHLMKQAKRLGLCSYKNPSWKAAESITKELKKLDPVNPCRFDFALCHLGMKGQYFSLANP